MPLASSASAFLISSSMTSLNASKGCAPTNSRPLMKKVGVPLAPTAVPAAESSSTRLVNLPESSAALNLPTSRPISCA